MKRSQLFLGLEGGLMHTANAVGVPAVIVWGGLTLPEFAGYHELHAIVHRRVECAPCGLRGNCPYGRKCLTGVGLDEVWERVDSMTECSIGA
jgi:ADP-heptose:LPS heptosyltransferase